jgi:hypothetical protein
VIIIFVIIEKSSRGGGGPGNLLWMLVDDQHHHHNHRSSIPHRPASVAVVGPVVAEEVEVPLRVGKESCNDSDSYSFFRMFTHC